MEVDPLEITDDYILKLTGVSRLGHVKQLNLQDHGLEELSVPLLERMPVLERLDVSNNKLASFPTKFILRRLKSLDLSNNNLTTISLESQFLNLEELCIAGNEIKQSDKHILVETCPKLVVIDNHKTDSLRNLNKRICEKIQTQLDAVWEDDYSEVFFNGIDLKLVPKTISELVEKVNKQMSNMEKKENSMIGAQNFLLRRLAETMVCDVQSGCYSPRKKAKMMPNIKPVAARESPSKRASPCKKPTSLVNLPEVCDYDPVYFIRCHYGDRRARDEGCTENDPTDEYTKVWQCAFEPDPHDPKKDTGLVATCGGQIVNLIDCSTGKLIKRYRHPHEQFYAVAWTTLTMSTENGERRFNILAVGGYDACLKLINPEQFECYKEWGTGKPNKSVSRGAYYISDLLFHPQHKTWLFSGASDTTVTLWDIGGHDDKARKLMVFACDQEILHLAVSVHTNHLVAACGEGIVAWNLPRDSASHKLGKKQHSVELEVPCHHVQVDGMALLTDDLVACKCVGAGNIFVWSLSDCLKNTRSKHVEIKPLLKLQWKKTREEFINLGAKNGIIACGDEEGGIYLYNLQSWIKKSKHQASDTLYSPSRILEWPECSLNSDDKHGKNMTDVLDKPSLLIVNDVSISHSGEFIVAATDNNLVCIWKMAAQ